MRRQIMLLIALLLLAALAFAPSKSETLQASEDGVTRVDGVIDGAPYFLYRPADWNGDLVLLVHGSLPDVFEFLAQDLASHGFGVAYANLPPSAGEAAALKLVTTNTRIVEAKFTSEFGQPQHTYLYGLSRGAHNMTHLLETSPSRYDGMFSACGGNGGSQLQWNYFFTARVLFDYYYPGVLPGTPVSTPDIDRAEYAAEIAPLIAGAILANPGPAFEMAAVEQYPLRYDGFGELVRGIVHSLAIHTIGVDDLMAAAHGNPFDNQQTVYAGTSNDGALNAGIARFSANPQARAYLRTWHEPDGTIAETPVLLLHTTRDPAVPEELTNGKYRALIESTGNGEFLVRRTISRFGHCRFSPAEMRSNFFGLVHWVETGVPPAHDAEEQ